MADALSKKLKSANAAFSKARAAVEADGGKKGDFFNEVGRFDCMITDSDVNESQNGRPQCYLEFTILDGEFKGETFRNYWSLEANADRLSWLIKDMARLGRDLPEDLEEIAEFLQKIVKDKVSVKVRRVEKGEFVNNYIGKLIDGGEGGGEAAAEAGGDGEGSADGDDAPSFVPEVGQRVVHAEKGAGVVKSTDEDDKDAVVKFDGGSKETVAWADLQAEEAGAAKEEPAAAEAPAGEDDGDSISVGKKLMVEGSGVGTVTKIDEKNSKVTLKLDKGGKSVTVGVEKLSLPPAAPAKPAGMRVGKK